MEVEYDNLNFETSDGLILISSTNVNIYLVALCM